jgi:hypothetical protein
MFEDVVAAGCVVNKKTGSDERAEYLPGFEGRKALHQAVSGKATLISSLTGSRVSLISLGMG